MTTESSPSVTLSADSADTTIVISSDEPRGLQGVPGRGVPSGGTRLQILHKLSDADYNTGWIDLGDLIGDTLTGYVTSTALAAQVANINESIANTRDAIPDISGLATVASVDALSTRIDNLNIPDATDLTGYATQAWVGQQGYLTTVAYSDITGKPVLATVATSGSYDDLDDTPDLSVYLTAVAWDDVNGKPANIITASYFDGGEVGQVWGRTATGQGWINQTGSGGGTADSVDWANVQNKPDPLVDLAGYATDTELADAIFSGDGNIVASDPIQLTIEGRESTVNTIPTGEITLTMPTTTTGGNAITYADGVVAQSHS